ncbi:XisI protein [Roseofilum casamattae]|uniref:XisI protein n=1 Tax=Roseofilum casamattae BLCC-M143 TaxID=3022442 RepID=A0ABT7BVK3_9CYAN|nr:XisI protein [Roseofilum casamattae]MDJ1183221.1 XisI protein [Roseofilum casamattae BLCC-M143]
MDKLEHYRQLVQELLAERSKVQPAYGEIQMKLMFDQERDRYQLLRAGWLDKRRVYGALIHIDLEGEKIWIQYDGTEVGIAVALTEAGVPKEDIVLAYHSPFMRQFNGYAVG